MVSTDEIKSCANTIAERFKPQRIILFGSHADGSAHDESDVDLLVLMPYHGKSSQAALTIRKALRKNFPLDILVKDPKEADQRIALGDSFLKEAIQRGRVLYERH